MNPETTQKGGVMKLVLGGVSFVAVFGLAVFFLVHTYGPQPAVVAQNTTSATHETTNPTPPTVAPAPIANPPAPTPPQVTPKTPTAPPPPVAPVPKKTTPTPPPAIVSRQTYKNGTYTAKGAYKTPGKDEEITVTLTLAGDKITVSKFVGVAAEGISQAYMDFFAKSYQDQVVGKSVDAVTSVVVSGASLTPIGFMEALAKIKAQAHT